MAAPPNNIQAREQKIAEAIIVKGQNPARAVQDAGFRFSNAQAQRYGEQIREKYNDRLKNAYEHIGLTAEYIANKHLEIIEDEGVKAGDKLKAIDQVLNITGGYAPKQVEVSQVTFEQAVINIANNVSLNQLSADDVRKMLDVKGESSTDAEFVVIE